MSHNEAILLTPPGAAAIAVVRLQGPNVRDFLAAHFSAGVPEPLRCRHGNLSDGDRVIDDLVVVLSQEKQTADLNLHGGTWVVTAAMQLAEREGFRIVKPSVPLPPFAIDANTTIEEEVLSHLPMATTELALSVLLSQQKAWADLIESIPDRARIDAILADRSLHWLLNPPRVAIAGAPNVGKSTLANRLFARERSITADLPGTTRDWIGEMANLDGLAVMLVDTPGLRETDDPIEREAIARSRTQIDRADLVLHILDVTQPPSESQFETDVPVITVLNKCDLPALWQASTDGIHMCAKSGEGVAVLIDRIKQALGCSPIDITTPRCWTPRQRKFLKDGLK